MLTVFRTISTSVVVALSLQVGLSAQHSEGPIRAAVTREGRQLASGATDSQGGCDRGIPVGTPAASWESEGAPDDPCRGASAFARFDLCCTKRRINSGGPVPSEAKAYV
jgi:hypothetical protein